MRRILLVFSITFVLSTGSAIASSSSSDSVVPAGAPGCCPGPDQGELEIDVLDAPSPGLDTVVGDFYEFSHSVVFAPDTHAPAPGFPDTYVRIDQARPEECDLNLNRQWAFAAGNQPFPPQGDEDEVFQFWNEEPMVVDRVRVSVGFINDDAHEHTVTVKAYDCDGDLLEEIPNGVFEGFQEFDIDRRGSDPDIHYVTVSAPDDPQGVSVNCIRFPPPVPCAGVVSVESSAWGRVKAGYR